MVSVGTSLSSLDSDLEHCAKVARDRNGECWVRAGLKLDGWLNKDAEQSLDGVKSFPVVASQLDSTHAIIH